MGKPVCALSDWDVYLEIHAIGYESVIQTDNQTFFKWALNETILGLWGPRLKTKIEKLTNLIHWEILVQMLVTMSWNNAVFTALGSKRKWQENLVWKNLYVTRYIKCKDINVNKSQWLGRHSVQLTFIYFYIIAGFTSIISNQNLGHWQDQIPVRMGNERNFYSLLVGRQDCVATWVLS